MTKISINKTYKISNVFFYSREIEKSRRIANKFETIFSDSLSVNVSIDDESNIYDLELMSIHEDLFNSLLNGQIKYSIQNNYALLGFESESIDSFKQIASISTWINLEALNENIKIYLKDGKLIGFRVNMKIVDDLSLKVTIDKNKFI